MWTLDPNYWYIAVYNKPLYLLISLNPFSVYSDTRFIFNISVLIIVLFFFR